MTLTSTAGTGSPREFSDGNYDAILYLDASPMADVL
jgi:hypothetical protein